MEARIGLIGTGQMATALARGFVNAKLSATKIRGYDVSAEALKKFSDATGATTTDSLADLVANTNCLFLAVKPQFVSDVLRQLEGLDVSRQLLVSIAAGVTLARLEAGLPEETAIVRVMPNTPTLVGKGAYGYCVNAHVTDWQIELIDSLLACSGVGFRVPEAQLNAVTGLSGSGPAYVYQIIEALSDGGVKQGLPRAVATRLAAQTVLGAAAMVLETGEHPGALKDAVTSPGGTTIAGLHALERGGLRAAIMNAVQAATERADQLSDSSQ